MDKVIVNTADLTKDFSFDGLTLSPAQVKNLGKFYGIPEALHSVDKKFGTSTFHEVLQAATPTLEFLVENDKVQVLDPKSKFLDDTEFLSLIESSGFTPDIETKGFQKTATVKLASKDSDSFLKDAFSRQWTITRRAEGGLSFSTEIIRLACTNGLTIPDKQFSGFIRNANVDNTYISGFHNSAESFDVDSYLKGLFTVAGEPVQCSVSDMMEMHKCLADLTQDDIADMLFPITSVTDFYANQNIDVKTLSRKYLEKLPSGLSYYEALNILTNGAKSMIEPNIDNQIRIAKFCTPKRMSAMQNVELVFQGAPRFNRDQIHSWMGDR